MAESLFTDTHLDGASLNENDSQEWTLGTVIDVAVDGVVTHGRWRFPNTLPSGAVNWVLYDFSTETEIGRATFTAPTAGAWNTAALSSPVAVTAGQRVVACVETPDRYVAKAALFSSAIVSGSLTGPATTTVQNGRFATAHGVFPTGSTGGNGYFADLVFDTGAPASGSAGVGLDVAVTAAGGRVGAGVAGFALALTVAAQGTAPPVAPASGSASAAVSLSVSAHGRAPGGGSAGSLYGETAVVVRAPLADDGYGNRARDWDAATRTQSHGWGFAPRRGDENAPDGGPGVIVGLTGYGPPDADVLPTDRVEVRGQVYEVVGEVGVWRSPFTGWEPGVEVALRRVYVAEV